MLRHSLKVILLAIGFVVAAAPSYAQVVVPPGGCIPVVHRNWAGCVVPQGQATTFCVIRAGQTAQSTMVLTQAGYDALIAAGQIRACAATPSCTESTETRTQACPAGQTGIITEQRTVNLGDQCGVNGNWNQIGNTCTTTCTEGFETRTSTPCPAGQQGLITERRTTNTGGVCGVFGNWTQISNTCAPCTQGTETRTQACPAGQTGIITEQRTTNTGGVCGAYGNWNQISNTCQPISCTTPWGQTLTNGQSVTAYQTATVPGGQVCISQTRTCNNGVLSGTYQFQNCSVVCTQTTEDRTVPCPTGQVGNIIERRTVNVGGVCGQNSSWAEVTRACEPVTCPLPWGGQILYGQSVTAYLSQQSQPGQSCVYQTRTCQANGTLTGTYQYQNCTNVCVQETETRTSTPCPSGQTGVITETRTLNVNGQCGQHSNWTQTSNTCTPITCPLPWGGTIGVGQSVTAYQTSTVPNGQQCNGQTRTCQPNGILSGTFTYQNCTVTCTQQTETRTQVCPAGQSGTITEQRTVNIGGVCGNNGNWTQTSSTCQPATEELVLLLAKPKTVVGGQVTQWQHYPYCTNHYAAIGLEFDPARPYKVDVVLLTGAQDGRLGYGCGSTGDTGRLKFAEIPLVGVQTGQTFTLTATFYANIQGCGYAGSADANGSAKRIVSLNVDKTKYSTSYVDFVYDTNGNQLTGEQAANAIITQIPCIPYADFTGRAAAGLFGLCSASGTQTPGYMILANKYVQIQ